jgi:hypothetical protein
MKKYFITQLFLIITGIFLLFCSGCGGDSTVTVLPTATPGINPTPSSDYPLSDQQLKFLTDGEISSGQGLPSRRLGYVAHCINITPDESSSDISGQGVPSKVAGIGKMLFTIAYHEKVKESLYDINKEIQALAAEIDVMNQKLDNLSSQLALTQVNIQTYISSLNVQNYITPIKTAYSDTGSGLVYYSNEAVLIDANSPDAVPLATLQQQEQVYITEVTSVTSSGISTQVQGIHDSICPDLSSLNGVLKDYTNKIILDSSQNGNNQNVKDPNNVMATYLLLETYYAQLLTYQFQGATILVNAYNVQDSTGNQTKAYLNGTFKKFLKDEMAKYLDTVDYMVINLVDYRDQNTYSQDMAYYKQGLATDNLYLSVLARSRFFCAQIMEAYENDFGLYGAITVPYNYTGKTNITLSFQGPSGFNRTITPEQFAGVYPYAKWSGSNVSPDNQWLFYDMYSTDPNIPGGTYNVSFVDSGSTNPWPHSDTKLGTVSVKYYDPNNPDPGTATLTPTETNTLPFGYFSLKWPWSIQPFCSDTMNYWTIPGTTKYIYPNGTSDKVSNPESYGLHNCTFSPLSSTGGFINQMHITEPYSTSNTTSTSTLMKYMISSLPFTVQGAPGDSSTASAKIIYYNSAKINTTASSYGTLSTQYNYILHNQTKSKTDSILGYNSDGEYISLNTSLKGLTSFPIYTNDQNTLEIDESYYLAAPSYGTGLGSADISITWYIQMLYTNTYNIFQ